MSFEEFIDWVPEDGRQYELHNGGVVEMQLTGPHELVGAFLGEEAVLVEYEAMGIAEYWIADFRALGAMRYIGQPKQPTITVCKLIDGEYQLERLVAGQQINSSIFPKLNLTVDRIFESVAA